MKLIATSIAVLATLASCRGDAPSTSAAPPPPLGGPAHAVQMRRIAATLSVAGVATPIQQATLSTKLMGTVTGVYVQEGERVAKGQVLARIDASDIAAKRDQVGAGRAEAEAMYAEATRQLERMRTLYAEKAAPKTMLEQAETGHARASAGLEAARARGAELDAVGRYSEVRAPFAGVVSKRFVDAGAFAAPGAPLLIVQDASVLRVSAAIAPAVARAVVSGQDLELSMEGQPARGKVEGVVPASGGSLHTVNVLVENDGGTYLSGGAATVLVPQGEREALLVPTSALQREGDLVGVRIRGEAGPELRWLRVGQRVGEETEVLSGLRAGEEIILAVAGGN